MLSICLCIYTLSERGSGKDKRKLKWILEGKLRMVAQEQNFEVSSQELMHMHINSKIIQIMVKQA